MPFSEIKKTNEIVVKVLAIISILIVGIMVLQTMQDYKVEKRKTNELSNILKIVSEQNVRSIEDRRILHEQNYKSIKEREDLFKRIDKLEREQK